MPYVRMVGRAHQEVRSHQLIFMFKCGCEGSLRVVYNWKAHQVSCIRWVGGLIKCHD